MYRANTCSKMMLAHDIVQFTIKCIGVRWCDVLILIKAYCGEPGQVDTSSYYRQSILCLTDTGDTTWVVALVGGDFELLD